MNISNRLLTSVLGGEVVTLLSRKLSNTPLTLTGATHYGYPFAWLVRLDIPRPYFPWRIAPLNFLADVVIWSVVVGVAILALERAKKRKRTPAPA
jgi:hypothetical protein